MDKKKIWIVNGRNIAYNSINMLQILGRMQQLREKADFDCQVVCIGPQSEEEIDELFWYGAGKVIFCESDKADLNCYIGILEEMIKVLKPDVVLFDDSEHAVPAVLATRLGCGLVADCIDLDFKDGNLVFSRTAINSSMVADIICVQSQVSMCTVKENAFQECRSMVPNDKKIQNYHTLMRATEGTSKYKLLEHIAVHNRSSVNLKKAKVIFAVGRGIKNDKELEMVFAAARKFGAEVVGTRAAIEENYMEPDRQVGQSGVSISPDLYIGFGISGASQHMVGLKKARIIVAVNKDENAAIFKYADYCIVDHAVNILEWMLEA